MISLAENYDPIVLVMKTQIFVLFVFKHVWLLFDEMDGTEKFLKLWIN